MIEVWAGAGDRAIRVRLPDATEEVVPGVAWGRPDVPMTPAYWAVRCRWATDDEPFVTKGGSLIEEVAFCLLGGFGITYEVNAAAFVRLKAEGAFEADANWTEVRFLDRLSEPLHMGSRSARYRFPRQRARRLARMRPKLGGLEAAELDALRLRSALLEVEGIGPKTASWIVRNLVGSDEVAILDVHVVRACRAMAVFPERVVLPRDYDVLEVRFLSLASAMEVRPSILDAVMWTEMRTSTNSARS